MKIAAVLIFCLAVLVPMTENASILEIKVKDIMAGMYQNFRHQLVNEIKGTKYQKNFILWLDLFTDTITVRELLTTIFDKFALFYQNMISTCSEAFSDPIGLVIREDIVQGFKNVIANMEKYDVLSLFIGGDSSHLYSVIREQFKLTFKDEAELKIVQDTMDILEKKTNGMNNGSFARLKAQQEELEKEESQTTTAKAQ